MERQIMRNPPPAPEDNPAEITGNPAGTFAGIPADTPANNWVDRHMPPWSRPWLRLSRADRPIGTWLLLLPCWWGVGLAMIADRAEWRDLWIGLACLIGAGVMRGAGCTWNDITDRDFDGSVARTRNRPLPSGQVTLTGAYLWLGLQLLIGLAILLTLGKAAIWMGVISLGPVAIYPFAKRFTWWPQVFLGIAFNWGVMLAWAAHMGTLGLAPVIAWLAGIAWTVHYDTIYAHQDIEDDILIGVKSTARLFGEETRRILAIFALLAVVGLALALVLTGAEGWRLGIAMLGLLGFGMHLAVQLWRLDIRDGAGCLDLFRSNRDAGLLLAASWAIAGLL